MRNFVVELCFALVLVATAAAQPDGDAGERISEAQPRSPPHLQDNGMVSKRKDLNKIDIREITRNPPETGRIFEGPGHQLHVQNWQETVTSPIAGHLQPKSIFEVQQMVKAVASRHGKIRVMGSGHAGAPLLATSRGHADSSFIMSLDRMPRGIVSKDDTRRVVEVWAGMTLRELNPLLWEAGYTLRSHPAVDMQTVAGAISTSTHSSQRNEGTLSSQVVGLTMVDGNGDVVVIESKDRNLPAYRQALGALGIIIKVKFRVVPRQTLRVRKSTRPAEKVLDNLEAVFNEGDQVEIHVSRYTDKAVVSIANLTRRAPSPQSLLEERRTRQYRFGTVTRALSALSAANTSLVSTAALALAAYDQQPEPEVVDVSYRVVTGLQVFSTKFKDADCFIPIQTAAAAWREMKEAMRRRNFHDVSPVLLRTVWADDRNAWLSPASSVPSPSLKARGFRGQIRQLVVIDVFEYIDLNQRGYLEEIERIAVKHGGRLHNAKWHNHPSRRWDELIALYPRVPDFLRLREQRDPQEVFLNDWVKEELLVDEFERKFR